LGTGWLVYDIRPGCRFHRRSRAERQGVGGSGRDEFHFQRLTSTDALYRIPSLQPGAYRVSLEAAGFKKLVRENVDLRTGDNLAGDMELQV
jgi:hypothetical protein